MKFFQPTSLIRHMCLLHPTILIWWMLHPLLLFLKKNPSNRSLDTDSDDENPPLHVPPPSPAPPITPQLPQWVCSTRESIGDLVGDPIDKHQTHSHF